MKSVRRRNCRSIITVMVVFSAIAVFAAACPAASPSPEQALKLAPTQEGVDYDRQAPQDVARCKISARRGDGQVGWVVTNPDGVILRKFVDTNGDNVVDQWSYYKDGVEVYRDMDSRFKGKADQFRWFHTGGTRWGIDNTGNGKVGRWKAISAEEVTAEVVAALVHGDPQRFSRVLLTPEELQSLGLGQARADALATKIAKAEIDFRAVAARQKTITRESKWVQFSGARPGTVPAGTDDCRKDLRVYENAVAIVQTGERHNQVQIGTLVQVGDVWKVIEAPMVVEGPAETPLAGFFFHAAPAKGGVPAVAGPTEEGQKLLAELGKLDESAASATALEKQIQYNVRRAELLEQLAQEARSAKDRAMWYQQLADGIGAAVQAGKCPDGDKRLQALFEKLQKNDADKSLAAHVRFCQLQAEHGLAVQAPKVDFPKAQAAYVKKLEEYIGEYPGTPDAAEAMLQLGIDREFNGQEDDAKQWYRRVVKEFGEAPQAKKAAGAALRLESVGKRIALSGKSPEGGTVDLAGYRGKVVLIQYWATWCSPCKNDIAVLKQLAAKYAANVVVIGVSLDTNAKDLNTYLADNPLPWPQIYEEGGLDSRPANQLGILTLPTMLLVDAEGKVVSRNIQIGDVESEVKKLVR